MARPAAAPRPPTPRGPGTTDLRAALRAAALVGLAAGTVACAGHYRTPPEGSGPVEPGWSQEGVASWYGGEFHGRPTASGEVYDMEAMTAAHPTLPLGTRIRVTVLETGRRTVLRVNDRGPFVDDRIVDVSRAAARLLGFLDQGTARVRLEVVEAPPDCWEVQVGSYAEEANARSVLDRLRRRGEPVRSEAGPDGFTRVVAGPYGSRDEARRLREDAGGIVRGCSADAAA